MISLGIDGKDFVRVGKLSDVASSLGGYHSVEDSIIAIYPITKAESNILHCLAVTSHGIL